jgi:hypothetical protein
MRRLPRPKPVYRPQRDPGKKPKGAKDGWIGVVVERDDPDDRRSPGSMHVYGRQGYLGAFRTNENGFIGKSRGVPAGHYTLQPKRKSGANWPAQTPAITGPGQPVGKPGPGYKADAILLHPGGRPGVPDSLSCITDQCRGLPPHHAHHASGSGFDCAADRGLGGPRCPIAIFPLGISRRDGAIHL